MNLQSLEAELKRIDRRREKLKKRYEARKAAQLTALPSRVGLKSVDALIVSLVPFASPRLRSTLRGTNGHGEEAKEAGGGPASRGARVRRRGPGRPPGRVAARAQAARRRGRRPSFSEETRAAVRQGLEKGMTAVALGKQYGVSPYSIKDWKKQWGLTKARKAARRKK